MANQVSTWLSHELDVGVKCRWYLGCCAIQRLDLRLLIHAEHKRTLRRIQIQSDHIAHLVDEQQIGLQLERLRAVRLQPVRVPDAHHRRLAHMRRLCHRARAPVCLCGIRWSIFERLADHALHVTVGDAAWSAGTRCIAQAINAIRKKTSAPLPNGLKRDPQGLGHCRIRCFRCACQNHSRTIGQCARRLRAATPRRELRKKHPVDY